MWPSQIQGQVSHFKQSFSLVFCWLFFFNLATYASTDFDLIAETNAISMNKTRVQAVSKNGH